MCVMYTYCTILKGVINEKNFISLKYVYTSLEQERDKADFSGKFHKIATITGNSTHLSVRGLRFPLKRLRMF
jgi:hypothetical protein